MTSFMKNVIKELNDEIKEIVNNPRQMPTGTKTNSNSKAEASWEDMSFNANPTSLVGAMLKALNITQKQKLTTS